MKIVFACGGSGGHIFPAFSVAEELERRRPGVRILYVCGKRDIVSTIFKAIPDRRIVSIENAAFRGPLSLLNPLFLIRLGSGFYQAFRLLARERPNLVVGFGGYFSFPVVAAAAILKIKTLIHEQNVEIGSANRVLSRFADGVALSFPETRKQLVGCRRLCVTGNPIRALIERDCRREALQFFGFSPEKRTILVLGGSQGAESINSFFLGSLKFLPEPLKRRLQVLHLCGRMPPEAAERIYRGEGIRGAAYSFFDRMDLAYGAADLSLGRAGATFLAEVKDKDMPVILVPYPYGSGHQRANAEVFGRDRSAVILEQKELTFERLAAVIEETLCQLERNGEKSSRRGSFEKCPPASNARALLADTILEFADSPLLNRV